MARKTKKSGRNSGKLALESAVDSDTEARPSNMASWMDPVDLADDDEEAALAKKTGKKWTGFGDRTR
jgi:hypothetical protein